MILQICSPIPEPWTLLCAFLYRWNISFAASGATPSPVSVTERTREIGVRMALGAKRSTIRMQFVIEAIVLCIFGGMIGILIGVFNGFVLGKAAEFVIQNMYSEYSSYIIMSVRPSLSAIVLSLFFSMLTGVFFGYYPANKAAKMEVIDALRYE